MRRFALAGLLLTILPLSAWAQSCPGQLTPGFTGTGTLWSRTADQVNAYFGSKPDVVNGCLKTPTLINPIIIGGGGGSGITAGIGDVTFSGSGAVMTTLAPMRTISLGANLTLETDPGAVTGALKSDGAGTFAQAACSDLSNGGVGCSAGSKVAGCVGDGVTNDTTCMQAAITAAHGKTLYLGPYLYSVNALTTGTITLIGQRFVGGIYNRPCTYGLKSIFTTETLITVSENNSDFENVCIQMADAPNTQTAGIAIKVVNGASNTFHGGQINYPFIGIDISGVAGSQNITNHIDEYVITEPSTGGVGIRVGMNSTNQSTVDLTISHSTVDCLANAGTVGMYFVDSGGAFIHDNDIYACGIGTKILPLAASQYVTNNFFSNTVLGDTSLVNDLLIDTGSATGGVGLGNVFQGTWTASAAGTSVLIKNTAGGSSIGNHFRNHRFFPAANQIALDIEQGNEVTVSGSRICSQGGTSGNLVVIADSAQLWSFVDNALGSCDGFGGTTSVGMNINANAGAGRIQNNTFFQITTPIVWATTGTTTADIGNNLGLDNLIPTIASAGTITLPFGKAVSVTGTTTISTINGMWSNREAIIVPWASLPFTTGGNICNAGTGIVNVPVFLIWNAAFSCWNIK